MAGGEGSRRKQRELCGADRADEGRYRAGRAGLRPEQGRRVEVRQADPLEAQLKAEEERVAKNQGGTRLLKEEVDEEDIAEVVSRWTGIPVSKLLEGEIQKLLHARRRAA